MYPKFKTVSRPPSLVANPKLYYYILLLGGPVAQRV